MSHLIPVKKLDKNGREVTRHMKPERATGSRPPAKAFAPAPVLSERERVIRDCGPLVKDGENEIALSSLGEQELNDFVAVLGKCEMDSDFRLMQGLLNPRKKFPYEIAPSLSDDLRNLAKYSGAENEGVKLTLLLSMTRGLWAYDGLGTKKKETPEDVKVALVETSLAAIKLLNKMPNAFLYPDSEPDHDLSDSLDNYYSFFGGDMDAQSDASLWIRNERFVDLIRRRPEASEEIIQTMNNRMTLQPDIIEAVLDFDAHTSLKDGAL